MLSTCVLISAHILSVSFTQYAQVLVKKISVLRFFKSVMFKTVAKMTADDVSPRCVEFIKGKLQENA